MPLEHQQYEREVGQFFQNVPLEGFELSKCIFCETHLKSKTLFLKNSMTVVQCDCGFIYNKTQPTLKVLTEFYEKSNAMKSWMKIKSGGLDDLRQSQKFDESIRLIGESIPTSVLDVGCGAGYFLKAVKRKMPETYCYGIDTGIEASDGDITFRKKGYEEFFYFCEAKFDIISFWGVLEHVKSPLDLLHKAKKALSPGGQIIICVPNCESKVVMSLFDKCFTFCPQHLWYFSYRTLERVLNKSGFIITKWFTVEPETSPIIKHRFGYDPYGTVPKEIEDQIGITSESEALDVITNNQGYKIVVHARAI